MPLPRRYTVITRSYFGCVGPTRARITSGAGIVDWYRREGLVALGLTAVGSMVTDGPEEIDENGAGRSATGGAARLPLRRPGRPGGGVQGKAGGGAEQGDADAPPVRVDHVVAQAGDRAEPDVEQAPLFEPFH